MVLGLLQVVRRAKKCSRGSRTLISAQNGTKRAHYDMVNRIEEKLEFDGHITAYALRAECSTNELTHSSGISSSKELMKLRQADELFRTF